MIGVYASNSKQKMDHAGDIVDPKEDYQNFSASRPEFTSYMLAELIGSRNRKRRLFAIIELPPREQA